MFGRSSVDCSEVRNLRAGTSPNGSLNKVRESPPVSIHAEASSNGLSESHRHSQSKLRPHQISHPGIASHPDHITEG